MQRVNTIIRMGRGAQMGVDHNKGMEWVGASAAFIESMTILCLASYVKGHEFLQARRRRSAATSSCLPRRACGRATNWPPAEGPGD